MGSLSRWFFFYTVNIHSVFYFLWSPLYTFSSFFKPPAPLPSFYLFLFHWREKKIDAPRRELPYSSNSYLSQLTVSAWECPASSLVALSDLVGLLFKAKPFHCTQLIPSYLSQTYFWQSPLFFFYLINNISFPIESFPITSEVLNCHLSYKNRIKPPWIPLSPVATAITTNFLEWAF